MMNLCQRNRANTATFRSENLKRSTLMKTLFSVGAITLCAVALAACGHGVEQRAATGAVAGAVVAGPVGAAVGAGVGAAVSKAAD
jgi:uncharacterized protein YaaW (UPF0174 family)